jgi:hypothetical protein
MAIAQQPHNREIEKAVIDQLGPLGDGENDGMQVKIL